MNKEQKKLLIRKGAELTVPMSKRTGWRLVKFINSNLLCIESDDQKQIQVKLSDVMITEYMYHNVTGPTGECYVIMSDNPAFVYTLWFDHGIINFDDFQDSHISGKLYRLINQKQ